jgi:hypothetical protein
MNIKYILCLTNILLSVLISSCSEKKQLLIKQEQKEGKYYKITSTDTFEYLVKYTTCKQFIDSNCYLNCNDKDLIFPYDFRYPEDSRYFIFPDSVIEACRHKKHVYRYKYNKLLNGISDWLPNALKVSVDEKPLYSFGYAPINSYCKKINSVYLHDFESMYKYVDLFGVNSLCLSGFSDPIYGVPCDIIVDILFTCIIKDLDINHPVNSYNKSGNNYSFLCDEKVLESRYTHHEKTLDIVKISDCDSIQRPIPIRDEFRFFKHKKMIEKYNFNYYDFAQSTVTFYDYNSSGQLSTIFQYKVTEIPSNRKVRKRLLKRYDVFGILK